MRSLHKQLYTRQDRQLHSQMRRADLCGARTRRGQAEAHIAVGDHRPEEDAVLEAHVVCRHGERVLVLVTPNGEVHGILHLGLFI